MEQIKAQRRMLICAAFFTFGSLCGVLTLFRLSPMAISHFSMSVCAFFSSNPLLLIPLTAALGPMLMLISVTSFLSIVIVCVLLLVYGFFGGALECLAVRFAYYPIINTAFVLLSSFCLMQIGGCVLRLALQLRRNSISFSFAGIDRSFDAPRIIGASVVLLLASLAFALFILNT